MLLFKGQAEASAVDFLEKNPEYKQAFLIGVDACVQKIPDEEIIRTRGDVLIAEKIPGDREDFLVTACSNFIEHIEKTWCIRRRVAR